MLQNNRSMPYCRNCGAHFPNRLTIEGKVRVLCNRMYCLGCSPWGKHNTRKLENRRRAATVDLGPFFCPQCRQTKPAAEFCLKPSGRRSFSWCRTCNNEQRKARFRADRLAALLHYSSGNPACACCGEHRLEFLGLDHVNNDGAKHRRQIGIWGSGQFYTWLRRTGYTYADLVVACHNCNMARAMYGKCPHQNEAPQLDRNEQSPPKR